MNINSWIIWGASGVVLLLLGALAVLLIINADQRAALAADDAARVLLQTQNKAWAEKMALSNAGVAALKTADAANAKTIARAEAVSSVQEKKLANEAALIAALKFPGSDCDQVIALDKFYLGQKP